MIIETFNSLLVEWIARVRLDKLLKDMVWLNFQKVFDHYIAPELKNTIGSGNRVE